jgi:hypothetical protein
MPQFRLHLPIDPGPVRATAELCRIARGRARAYRRLVSTRFAKFLLLAGLCHATPVFVGCGSTSTPADSVASAHQRLGGSWRLLSFSPATSLDLPLQAVLSAELGQLVVTFNQTEFTAVGPGVNFAGRFEVTSASGEQLSLILYDAQSVGYHFSAQFVGKELHFQSNDKPWVGFGKFERG